MVHVASLIGIFVFYLIILAVGFLAAWKKTRRKSDQPASETLIVAHRDISLILGLATMTAVFVGGGFINGITEVVFSSGVIWAQAPIGYSISGILGAMFFVKPMREKKYVTMLDPFQERYGRRIGGLMYLPALVGEIFWSGAILASLGSTLEVIIELDFTIAVVISGAVAVLYTFFGGQYSVCYTDAAQLILIMFGLVLCTPFAWTNQHVAWNQHAADNGTSFNVTKDWVGKLAPAEVPRYIDEYLLLILGGIPWQDYFQRFLCAKSVRNGQIVSYLCTVLLLLCSVPPALLGYVAINADWDAAGYNSTQLDASPNLVLPLVFQYLTPSAVAFCGLGAVAAGVMSSTDASVLSSSSMFTHNIYKNIFRPNASDRECVWVLRVGFIVAGAAASVLAIYDKSVYYLLVFCSDFVYVILFPQLCCVLFIPFVNSQGVVVGSLVGLLFRLLGGENMLFIPPVLKYPYFDCVNNKQMFPFKTFCMLLNLCVTCLVSIVITFVFDRYNGKRPVRVYDVQMVMKSENIKNEKLAYGAT